MSAASAKCFGESRVEQEKIKAKLHRGQKEGNFPTRTIVGQSDWGIFPSASCIRISRNIIQNKTKHSSMSSIS